MEMLVTKFSNGKYRNEGELFAEPISAENVKLMGEMIALQSLRTVKRYDLKIADKLCIGLIKDFHHMNEVGYVVSEGYDCAQIAICFLWQFVGRNVYDIYGKDRKGKAIIIKLACYREVGMYIDRLHRKAEKTDYIDFTDYKALPMDPVNCFEHEQTDYTKADALMDTMHLTEKERETLEYYMSGWKRSEVAKLLALSLSGMDYRKLRIRYKYHTYIGQY